MVEAESGGEVGIVRRGLRHCGCWKWACGGEIGKGKNEEEDEENGGGGH